jgi:hypothetical protein
MTGIEKVVKHLEMIQGVINRLGGNSFQLKGWSMTIIVAATVLIAKPDLPSPYFIFVLLIPILGFWGLDGYFLWQERLFREIYKEISQQEDTDFKMNVPKHKNKPKCSWVSATFSITLIPFYAIEIVLIFVVFVFTWYVGG